MKQIEVINLETIIDVTAETSNVEILVQDYDSELAERFALEAQESAIDAEESADIATAQASIATAQAGIATTQAGIATTQAGNALTSANNAAASAQEAQDIVDSIITADLTEATSSVLTITGGTDAVLGTGTTIQVKQAGTSQSGFLSSTDWTTFNSKQNTITNPVTGTGASGQVAFWNGTSSQTGDNGLQYNSTSGLFTLKQKSQFVGLRIENQDDSAKNFEVNIPDLNYARVRASNSFRFNISSGNVDVLRLGTSSAQFALTNGLSIGTGTVTPTQTLDVIGTGRIRNGVSLADTSGNVQIGTTTDAGFRLDVNGTARVTGAITGTSTLTLGQTGTNGEVILNRTSTGTSVGGIRAIGSGTEIGGNGYLDKALFANGSGIDFFTWTGVASNTNQRMKIFATSGNVLIQNGGTFTDAGFRLDVNGTARVQGNLTVNASATSNFQINSSVLNGRLGFQNLNTSQDCFIDLFSNATGNKSVGFAVWARGLPTSSTNVELLEFRYDATNTRFALNILQGGTGVLKPFHIYIGENTNQLKIQTNGNVSINSASDVASAQLQIDSTTRGFLPPRMTTTQKNSIASPATGLVVYDTTLNKLSVYTGLVWEMVTSL
jgi:hypothetical protein